MMFASKNRLALAIAGVFSLSAIAVQAEDFNASGTLQNTLAITNLQDFDIGNVFAVDTGVGDGTLYSGGVGAFVINAETGVATETASSATVTLTSLSTPTPAQGSVDSSTEFDLVLPDTSSIDPLDFVDDADTTVGPTLVNISTAATPLIHDSGNPAVPNLYMMHFTVVGVSDGDITVNGAANTGSFTIEPGFGVTSFVFNIGATVTTEPNVATTTEPYQEGIYTGTFTVLANY